MIFFTADTHFYHADSIKYFGRPFKDIEHMNNALIQNWNECVKENDEVYILGDFSISHSGLETEKILKKLNGKKYLIKGNHEHYLEDSNFNIANFEWIKDYFVFEHSKQKFVLFHYPIFVWDGFFENTAIHLYGHVHNMLNNKTEQEKFKILGKKAINVGVDMNNYYPISIEEIIKRTE